MVKPPTPIATGFSHFCSFPKPVFHLHHQVYQLRRRLLHLPEGIQFNSCCFLQLLQVLRLQFLSLHYFAGSFVCTGQYSFCIVCCICIHPRCYGRHNTWCGCGWWWGTGTASDFLSFSLRQNLQTPFVSSGKYCPSLSIATMPAITPAVAAMLDMVYGFSQFPNPSMPFYILIIIYLCSQQFRHWCLWFMYSTPSRSIMQNHPIHLLPYPCCLAA